jgi:hypothetical protein
MQDDKPGFNFQYISFSKKKIGGISKENRRNQENRGKEKVKRQFYRKKKKESTPIPCFLFLHIAGADEYLQAGGGCHQRA